MSKHISRSAGKGKMRPEKIPEVKLMKEFLLKVTLGLGTGTLRSQNHFEKLISLEIESVRSSSDPSHHLHNLCQDFIKLSLLRSFPISSLLSLPWRNQFRRDKKKLLEGNWFLSIVHNNPFSPKLDGCPAWNHGIASNSEILKIIANYFRFLFCWKWGYWPEISFSLLPALSFKIQIIRLLMISIPVIPASTPSTVLDLLHWNLEARRSGISCSCQFPFPPLREAVRNHE